ncbi:MAG: tRNA (adenosine(37)-N6)-threonylcarbamoyltransferase complex ATPase subunit type 1 TsaE [Bacteroidia bacterium]|nr:tRNA (adenosine(37)-N6)-threonylcarbamoyltransferase complex ATPase subunit type 1 TsaE [Bacteroidia bacterium]
MNSYLMPTAEDAERIAGVLLQTFPGRRIWLLQGDMGAGKTTLIKGFCKALGVTGSTGSPTFSIVNEYLTPEGKRICHFDFYRLKNETEALDIGAEEYFYSGDYCFIEWPERIPALIPEESVAVKIETLDAVRRLSAGAPEEILSL